MSEPQFNHFAPPGTRRACHARARRRRMEAAAGGDGRRDRPSAKLLSDVAPDLIVFHCTDTSMTQGPQGEGRILDIVTGRDRHRGGGDQPAGARSLAGARAAQARPAQPLQEQPERDRLSAGDRLCRGRGRGAGRSSRSNSPTVTPREWTELARQHDRPEADGIFLSCTNTTQIEAIADIERALGKPVVNSNQAVLWGCVKRLKLGARAAAADARSSAG